MIRSCIFPAVLSALAVLATGLSLSGAPPAPHYVGSQACVGCHADAAKAWEKSHHALAWTKANQTTVLGDFDGARFAQDGVWTQFNIEDGQHVIATEGPEGKERAYPVKGVAGIEPLQQYLLETAPGRLQAFDIAWDTEKKHWYHLYPGQDLKPGDGLHWTGPYKTWNARCADCHATGYEKNYDPKARRYTSTQAEIGVGCEACHGPGAAHLAWAEAPSRQPVGPGLTDKGFTIGFDPDSAETEIQQCAACHSRREPLGDASPVPGTPFHDAYNLALLREGLYHADGAILDEVFVYGSFLQSKMYEKGVRCSDCHEPHSAELKLEGNAICTQCHSPAGNPRFPSLRKAEYSDPAHHFHEPGAPGAQCRSCHMIERVYMGIDGRRDHSFRVPRPDLSVKIGTPNACTDCHADKGAEWAAAKVAQWFPDGRSGTPHYGETLHAGRTNTSPETRDKLLALARDTSEPAIVRATALDLLRRMVDASVLDETVPLLRDDSPLLRAAALRLFQAAPAERRLQAAAGLLDDPVRSVRLEAAKLLIGQPLGALSAAQRQAAQAVLADYQRTLFARADYPETQMQIAGVAMTLRNFGAAQGALKEALRMDPQLADAWLTLSRIQAALGQRDEALKTLERASRNVPDNGDIFHLLGALYAQQQAHQKAIEALERSLALAGSSPERLEMLALENLFAGNRGKAREYAGRLRDSYPGHQPSAPIRRLLKPN
ncbi:cytochrome c3 family protein [Dichotomicrobium thermohalophilum]|uniref:Cytochrome c554/c'-like protein n=1 Tax=Dichotomicrobium thermohalophilum TaxID=933063 RepID=A0A397PBW1_9HYPH|nr:multiheme c-type cytochrome [Dichotomicrobium thermohalophilum]RIA45419.1 cytochrome c554/c'-like protein [Dichotomicrobium thermohalophilum]